ncbi:glycoside hydrolase family 61 protein [Thermothelomyces thermophilus ATCC 42464]|uniref:lytic cellulose monooxygenase (C4-dehydrogenating) n=2 Tax=Thermothelomyces thermophilus (strain ATCC 42464 / BCRC 31852 / DSM 1799) TaxID=573729 RepID=G2Q9F7_THET4|nr:glycoside hydrolase family 61 protein [Thermothelomyces thermophilus ATCC 42464]AEO56416.1 glycoside hydrolase family 61 protein [Thermothelomyces thermophilus ATCC 42464]
MKPFSLVALATAVSGHAIFQRVSVNGQDQGQLKGVRAPSSNSPIQNVNDANMACNANIVYHDNTIIKVPAGARVGAWWQHVIGGPQGANDPDNPIAASHKGPIQVYLAKVDNAATASPSGLKWFKVAERGLNNGVWAVDELIANNGWHYFDLPSCVAPGQYLMRVELLALHSASSPGGAQFYMGCAQIEVTGSGTNSGSDFVSFPGAYSANDPGILLSIYDSSGKPNNGGRSYPIPGPRPISCSGSGGGGNNGGDGGDDNNGGGNNNGGGSVPLYGQCGGIGYTGPTTCAQGTCKVSNEYYSQCLP